MWLKEFFGPGLTTRYELERLKDYLEKLEAYLEEAKEKFENWANAEAAKLPSSEREQFDDALSEEYSLYSEVFPRILRSSFLVTLHSFLESELAWICESSRTKRDIPISWSKLRGSSMERAKVYILKLGGLDFPTGQPWTEIKSYIDIRNCIVHAAGNVRELRNQQEKKRLCDYCSKQAGISIDADGNLALSKEFCLQAVSTLQGFFEELYDSYEGKKAP